MSETTTTVDQALADYIAAHSPSEDRFLADLRAAAVAAGIPAIWIGPPQAAAMAVLLKIAGAKDVVEVGTLAGYSAISMARALPAEGRVRTLELLDLHADFAEEWIAKSDVAGRIDVLRGDARARIAELEAESADAVFIDADKVGYATYVEHGLRILRPGGLLMVDNAFAFGHLLDPGVIDDGVAAIRAINEAIPTIDGLDAALLPVGDGLWIGHRS